LVVCITFISNVWGSNYLLETKDKDSAFKQPYAEPEAGIDYSQDEQEPIKAETLICHHLHESALDEFDQLEREKKVKIVEDINQVIVNSRKQKDSKQGGDGDYYLNNNNNILKTIKKLTRGTKHLLSGINGILKLIDTDMPKPPSKIPRRRKFCFTELSLRSPRKLNKKWNKSKKCKQTKKSKDCKNSKYPKKPKGRPCKYKGKMYKDGDFMPCEDGCNKRVCKNGRPGGCTKMLCNADGRPCKYKGKTYKDGEFMPCEDGCNKRVCKNGRPGGCTITKMACVTDGLPCEYKGKTYSNGESMPCDECNKGICMNGQPDSCTEAMCIIKDLVGAKTTADEPVTVYGRNGFPQASRLTMAEKTANIEVLDKYRDAWAKGDTSAIMKCVNSSTFNFYWVTENLPVYADKFPEFYNNFKKTIEKATGEPYTMRFPNIMHREVEGTYYEVADWVVDGYDRGSYWLSVKDGLIVWDSSTTGKTVGEDERKPEKEKYK